MALLRSKDIAKMNEKEIEEKITELKTEIVKSRAANQKGGKSNFREIRKAIARLLTFKNQKNKKGSTVTDKKEEKKEAKK